MTCDPTVLIQAADALDATLTALDHDTRLRAAREEDRHTARTILTEVAAQCRRAATVTELDPTLADEPPPRELTALADLARQENVLVRRVLTAPAGAGRVGRDGAPIRQMWHEATALQGRAAELAEAVLAHARRDHVTVAGAQGISRQRAAAALDPISDAVATIRQHLRPAQQLPHVHPQVQELIELVDHIDVCVESLNETGEQPR